MRLCVQADYINIYNIEFSNFNYMYETIKVFLDIIKKNECAKESTRGKKLIFIKFMDAINIIKKES